MLIDCNANLGNWPFRRLRYNDPASLLERLGRVGIERAWVTLLDAVLCQNVHACNAPLAEMVADFPQLLPVATINPTWPGWERDLAECAGPLGFRGVRVIPNYHAWSLGDAVFGELLAAARDLGLMVVIAVRMADERHHHPLVMVPPVDLSPVPAAAAAHLTVPIVLANANSAEMPRLCRSAELPHNVYFEISHVESVNGMKTTADAVGVQRLLFGTHAPYFYPEAAHLKVFVESELSEAEIAAIGHQNAQQLVS